MPRQGVDLAYAAPNIERAHSGLAPHSHVRWCWRDRALPVPPRRAKDSGEPHSRTEAPSTAVEGLVHEAGPWLRDQDGRSAIVSDERPRSAAGLQWTISNGI